MFENITQSQIQNEAEETFKKEWPATWRQCGNIVCDYAYAANDIETAFEDGFLAGMIWWKAILVPDYDGPKSDLQIAVRKEIEPFFANNVLNTKSENENQLEFSFNKKSEMKNE